MFLRLILVILLYVVISINSTAQNRQTKWITTSENQEAANTWRAYRKSCEITKKPVTAIAKIAVDSKYWLWINGKQVIFESRSKRGPTTYFDDIDFVPF